MAFGDIGGVVTELVITCKTPDSGSVNIAKGDAVTLTGPYTVCNDADAESSVLGEALADSSANGETIPIKVRGVSVFEYEGETPPTVNGLAGIVAATSSGKVKAPASGSGSGINLKVDTAAGQVHVLL
jgi:hypothetical protein